ncbi:MAG: ribonuclease HI family protein [bacterium]|nr:ribonuclease HI family protein [bacterium]
MIKSKKLNHSLFATSNIIVVHIDGGARGNPGPAAIGVVLEYGGTKKKYGEAIGNTTNNIAEYSALIFALKKIKQLFGKAKSKELRINVKSDSELLVRQMNGIYKIEDVKLRDLFVDIWNLRLDFKSVNFTHIPREENKEADAMVNKALDKG